HQRGLPGPEPGMEAKQPGQGAEGLLAFGLERRRPDGFGGVHAVSSDCQVSVRDPYSGRERRLLRPPVPRPGEAGMARPIWSGAVSFGLLNIPVSLMPGARSTDLSFRMLDSRDRNPIRFERVNAETGEEVPWKEIVKAFEYDKGSYVVIEKEDIAAAAPETHESVDVEAFVDAASINLRLFEKPYVLVPGKKAEKGYVLLRETLRKTGKVGVARVVVRTREYLCAVMPEEDALVLILLRYPQELVDLADYKLPSGKPSDFRIAPREMTMAE